MNEEQKQRAVESLAAWRATAYALHADRMADLLQELVDAPEAEPVLVVETEPGYWTRGHYCEGTKSYIDPTKVWGLPVGTKLYTQPPAPQPPKSKPIAYIEHHKGGDNLVWDNPGGKYSVLYTAPLVMKLSDERIFDLLKQVDPHAVRLPLGFKQFAIAIEREILGE